MKKTILSCFILALSFQACADALIKQSVSEICHDQNSSHYNRIKNYIEFESMELCLQSGSNRAYKDYKQSDINKNSMGDYDRTLYPHWKDYDKDCQSTRTEILISQSVSPVTFKTGKECNAIKGVWNDPYSGNRYYNAIDLDIDHVVTLAWAHEHGGREMPPETKEKFANDPINLIAVDKSLNRQKGAKPPMDWMPPNSKYHCQYLNRFQRVMITYGLKFSEEEKREFNGLKLKACSK